MRSALTFSAILAVAGCTPPPALPLNVVVILADDLGTGDLGAYNAASRISTPAMDAIAREGVLLTDAHSPSAVCSPTRYSLLTGRYAWRTRLKQGVLWTDDPALIESDRPTIGSMLQADGYATAGFGKWHLGLGRGERTDYTDLTQGGPAEAGFDVYYGIPSSLDIPPYVWIQEDRVEVLATDSVEASSGRREGGGGFWRAGPMAPDFRFDKVLDTIGEKAAKYIGTRASQTDEPFFLYVPLSAPHTPWLPDSASQGESGAGYYGDFVVHVDAVVGQITKALDSAGLAENTLLIFTSDNGAHWTPGDIQEWGHRANGPWRGQKADIWEGGHRVPFIARWPGVIPAGSRSDKTVSLVDLMSTISAATAVALPESAGGDSWNVLPALTGSGEISRGPIVMHSLRGTFAIREGDWKLIAGLGSGGFSVPATREPGPGEAPGQLYNLGLDPAESQNVYAENPEVVERLAGLLGQYQDEGRSRAQRFNP
ncbi:MAG: arylsulfatase A [Rhodothermales bacterium]|jgi:arylsulfatase A